MQINGITFVGTRTGARSDMARFVRDVLGLAPVQVDGIDAEVFAMPDGSSFAVTSPDAPDDTGRRRASCGQRGSRWTARSPRATGSATSTSARRTVTCTSWWRRSTEAGQSIRRPARAARPGGSVRRRRSWSCRSSRQGCWRARSVRVPRGRLQAAAYRAISIACLRLIARNVMLGLFFESNVVANETESA